MSKRAYLDNPYQREFEAEIVKKMPIKDKTGIILNNTCFYPESGGQPCDKGRLNGIEVLKVFEDKGEIVHLLAHDIGVKKVKGCIDWNRRFDHMQQHTGQHILSQSFFCLLKADTLSFHLGNSESTIEVNLQPIKDEKVQEVELLTNEIIYQNRAIKTHYVTVEEAKRFHLRKPPPLKELLRVVEVSDFDFSACGGTHCRATGEIGILKIKKWEKIRDNLRFQFVCGYRALRDYWQKTLLITTLCGQLSSQESELLEVIGKLSLEMKEQRKKIAKLQEKSIEYEAEHIARQAQEKIIKIIFSDREPTELKYLALHLIKLGNFIVLFGLKKEKAYLFLARSATVPVDLRKIVEVAAPPIEGKGGGRPDYVEIGGSRKEKVEEALERAAQYLKRLPL